MKTNKNTTTPKEKLITLRNNFYILKTCFKTAPLYMCSKIWEFIFHQTQIFFEHTFGIKFILEVIEFNKPVWYGVVYLTVLIAWIAIFQTICSVIYFRIEPSSKPRIIQALRMRMYEKASKIDIACYDDPKFYNDFVLTVSEAENCYTRTMTVTEKLIRGITSVAITGSYFLYLEPMSAVFILSSFVLTLIMSSVTNKVYFKKRIERNPAERERSYLHRIFYLHNYAKELRLNPDIKKKLFKDFNTVNDKIYKTEKKYTIKLWFLSFVRSYLFSDFITDSLFIIFLIYKAAVLHSISYSAVVVLFNTSGNIKYNLHNIAEGVKSAMENSLFVNKIKTFLSIEPKVTSTQNLLPPEQPSELVLKNVSFSYDGKKEILHNISMTIHPKEKIALVGYNGAGKTTLVKLLMRLYDPSSGTITLNGKSLNCYDTQKYRQTIGVVFQDYQLFGATLGENLWLDDYTQKTSEEMKIIQSKCIDSLDKAGFSKRLKTMSKGIDTPLTTEFENDGTDLSGGESQKIAIARLLYKEAPLVILDEPSSALDPIAEYNLNKTMNEAGEQRTVVFISHRLSTTRDADKIFMFENGTIIEQGTHEELLKMNGKYKQMWETQASSYQK